MGESETRRCGSALDAVLALIAFYPYDVKRIEFALYHCQIVMADAAAFGICLALGTHIGHML